MFHGMLCSEHHGRTFAPLRSIFCAAPDDFLRRPGRYRTPWAAQKILQFAGTLFFVAYP